MTAVPRVVVLRVIAAALLLITALVHLNLYAREQYREIPTVGFLFLLTVISAVTLAVLLLTPLGRMASLPAALFALSVLGGYLLTLWLPEGLFGFKEPGISYSGAVSLVAEVGTAVLLGVVCRHDRNILRSGTARISEPSSVVQGAGEGVEPCSS